MTGERSQSDRISEHFVLREVLPRGFSPAAVPEYVVRNARRLAEHILEPARQEMGRPFIVNSWWRPPAHNVAVGGVPGGDHESASACDFYVAGDAARTWQVRTYEVARWIKDNCEFGQLILEDHRRYWLDQGDGKRAISALWVHVAIPTEKHPGFDDPNKVLVSREPHKYQPVLGGLA